MCFCLQFLLKLLNEHLGISNVFRAALYVVTTIIHVTDEGQSQKKLCQHCRVQYDEENHTMIWFNTRKQDSNCTISSSKTSRIIGKTLTYFKYDHVNGQVLLIDFLIIDTPESVSAAENQVFMSYLLYLNF